MRPAPASSIGPAESGPDAERELQLLIREARRRQRRRRSRAALFSLVVLAAVAAAAGQLSGWSSHASGGSRRSIPADAAGTECPVSPAGWVASRAFDAEVLGNGGVRLGIGVPYDSRRKRLVLVRGAHSWAGIEAIWWLARPADVHGPITVRGVAIDGRGAIAVKPSDSGLAPGHGSLLLPGGDRPATGAYPDQTVYPGSLWVRKGGCYALEISARGMRERLVFHVAERL